MLSIVVTPPAFIYMGRDKYENEDLIKYGLPEDVWYGMCLVSAERSSLIEISLKVSR